MLRRSNPAAVPAPIGGYHHTTVVPGGTELVFVSGQVGNYIDGRPLAPDAVGQARQALANIGAIVEDLGAKPEHIVKFVSLVAGAEHLAGCKAALKETFGQWYPDGDVPSHTLAAVAALAEPELLVEIETVVALPAAKA